MYDRVHANGKATIAGSVREGIGGNVERFPVQKPVPAGSVSCGDPRVRCDVPECGMEAGSGVVGAKSEEDERPGGGTKRKETAPPLRCNSARPDLALLYLLSMFSCSSSTASLDNARECPFSICDRWWNR